MSSIQLKITKYVKKQINVTQVGNQLINKSRTDTDVRINRQGRLFRKLGRNMEGMKKGPEQSSKNYTLHGIHAILDITEEKISEPEHVENSVETDDRDMERADRVVKTTIIKCRIRLWLMFSSWYMIFA